MGRNGHHRHTAEMEIARSAAPGAYRELASQRRVGSSGKGRSLFIPHPNPLDAIANPCRIANAVERIACHSVDATHTGVCQNFHKQFRYSPSHFLSSLLPAQQEDAPLALVPTGCGN